MTVRGVDYIYYEVSDVAKSREFYKEIIGLKVSSESEQWVEFDLGNVTLGIGSYGQSTTVGGTMVALAIDDVAAAAEELKAKNVPVTMGPEDFPTCSMAIITDLDGNKLMLHHRKDGTAG